MFRRSFSAKIVALLLLIGFLVAGANLQIVFLVEGMVKTILRDWGADASLRGIKQVDGYLDMIDDCTDSLALSTEQILEKQWDKTDPKEFTQHFKRDPNGTLVSIVHTPGFNPDDPKTYPEQIAAHAPKEELYRLTDNAKKFLLIADNFSLPSMNLAREMLHSEWVYLIYEETSVTYPFSYEAKVNGPAFQNSTRPYYKTLSQYDGEGKWTDPYLDASGKGWMITRSQPILFHGKPFGLAVQDVSLDLINETLLNIHFSQSELSDRKHIEDRPLMYKLVGLLLGDSESTETTRAYILKEDGQLLTTNDENMLKAMKSAGGIYYLWRSASMPVGAAHDSSGFYGRQLLRTKHGDLHQRGILKDNSVLFAYPLKSTGWFVLVQIDATDTLLAIQGLRVVLMGITSCGILIAIVLGFFFTRRFIANRIIAISGAAKKVSRGDLSVRVRELGLDEIGQLGKMFNTMVEGLLARQKEREVFGHYVSTTIRDRILKVPDALAGEEVEAVVLFSDIRSFSTYSEHKAPSEVVNMLNRLFSKMVKVIQDNTGIVDKFIGDAIMAVFGRYVGTPDPYRAAVKAAIEMRRELQQLNEEFVREGKETIEIGIGIHAGLVLAGNIGSADRKQFTVVGNTVDIASRLEDETKTAGHPILISAQVYEKCGDMEGVRFVENGEIQVKGKSQKIKVYRVEIEESLKKS